MSKAQDLLIVVEANKRIFAANCLLILLYKLGVNGAGIWSEPEVVDYVRRVCETILCRYIDGP